MVSFLVVCWISKEFQYIYGSSIISSVDFIFYCQSIGICEIYSYFFTVWFLWSIFNMINKSSKGSPTSLFERFYLLEFVSHFLVHCLYDLIIISSDSDSKYSFVFIKKISSIREETWTLNPQIRSLMRYPLRHADFFFNFEIEPIKRVLNERDFQKI